MKLKPGTCAECAQKAIDRGLFAAGCDWILSPEDGLVHWGRVKAAREIGGMKGTEYEVVCAKDFCTRGARAMIAALLAAAFLGLLHALNWCDDKACSEKIADAWREKQAAHRAWCAEDRRRCQVQQSPESAP